MDLDKKHPIIRGTKSQVFITGKHSYGINNIKYQSWGEGAHLYIGSFCQFASGTFIFLGGNHHIDWVSTYPFGHILQDLFPNGSINGGGHPKTNGHVVIENDVWIGMNVTIMSGITIGSGSSIGAGSLVTKDVEPYSIVGGNPSKFIKYRFSRELIQELLLLRWWDYEDIKINKIVPLLQMPLDKDLLIKIKIILNE